MKQSKLKQIIREEIENIIIEVSKVSKEQREIDKLKKAISGIERSIEQAKKENKSELANYYEKYVEKFRKQLDRKIKKNSQLSKITQPQSKKNSYIDKAANNQNQSKTKTYKEKKVTKKDFYSISRGDIIIDSDGIQYEVIKYSPALRSYIVLNKLENELIFDIKKFGQWITKVKYLQ
jgi:dsDNA-specific endonuclease/ATPase MutS2